MAVAKSYSLSALLNIPRIVFLGASLSDRALLNAAGDTAYLVATQNRMNAMGFTGVISSRAISGSTATSLLTQLATEKASRPGVTQWRDTLFIIDFAGNDVSNNRPYDAGEYAALRSVLEQLRIKLTEMRAPFIVLPITRRNYPTAPVVTQDGVDNDGSAPYNTNVVFPWLRQHAANMFVNDKYVINSYDLVRMHPGFLSSDGVHWFPDQQRLFAWSILADLSEWLKGNRQPNARGRSFGIDFTTVSSALAEPGYLLTSGGMYFNRMNRGCVSLVDLQGRPLGGVKASQNSFSTTGTSGTAGATARIADTRFHDTGTLLTVFSNISGADTFQVDISGLGAGSTGTLKAVASRDVADATRQTDFTINGVTATLNAANNAASNMITLPFTADADGHIRMTGILNAASGSSNGYLGAVIVDVNA